MHPSFLSAFVKVVQPKSWLELGKSQAWENPEFESDDCHSVGDVTTQPVSTKLHLSPMHTLHTPSMKLKLGCNGKMSTKCKEHSNSQITLETAT